MAQERVQKIIAAAGLASRREAERLIAEGEVTVNGRKIRLGDKADPLEDAIKVRDKLLPKEPTAANRVYFAFYKPKGVIAMMGDDPEDRPTLQHYVGGMAMRVFPVGRMDFNGEGLMILTNDGEFADAVQKRHDLPRVYDVKLTFVPDTKTVEKLRRGVRIGNVLHKPYSLRMTKKLAKNAFFEVAFVGMGTLGVREMFEALGCKVERVIRRGIGQIRLRGLKPGEYRPLKKSQIDTFFKQPELGLKGLRPTEEMAPTLTGWTEDERPDKLDQVRRKKKKKAAAKKNAAAKKPQTAPRGRKKKKKTGAARGGKTMRLKRKR